MTVYSRQGRQKREVELLLSLLIKMAVLGGGKHETASVNVVVFVRL